MRYGWSRDAERAVVVDYFQSSKPAQSTSAWSTGQRVYTCALSRSRERKLYSPGCCATLVSPSFVLKKKMFVTKSVVTTSNHTNR